jgi:hypothetical protein
MSALGQKRTCSRFEDCKLFVSSRMLSAALRAGQAALAALSA